MPLTLMTESARSPLPSGRRFPVLVVAGPTASGKTALALYLARHLHGEIVNFDSMQVYRDFDLGTAKPTPEEMAQAPHHLISVATPEAPFTAGEYARCARALLPQIATRGGLPILVGGTGFYLRALLEGLFEGPPADEALRQRLRRRAQRHGPESLHSLLRRLDPEAARRIAPRDAAKAIRALEVRILTGKPMAQLWREQAPEAFTLADPVKIGLNPPRAQLYERIDRRAAAMFAGGIQAETERLLQRYPAHLRVFEAHGYKQACDILLRGVPLSTALPEAQQEQRNYAKRQWTWFRRDMEMHWLDGFGDDPAIQAAALEWVKGELRKKGWNDRDEQGSAMSRTPPA